MKFPLRTAVAAAALLASSPAFADVIDARSSDSQGTLVHADGGAADVDQQVTGNLGGGPSGEHIVQFTGSTDVTSDTTDSNDLRLQQGAGQAELTGAVISGNDFYDIQSGDIWLEDLNTNETFGMEWIEMAFQDLIADSDPTTDFEIFFTLTMVDENGNPEADALFDFALDPNGENKFAFLTSNGEAIMNLHYSIVGGDAGSIRQIRIASVEAGVPPVPEPATWAMMLLGFGAAGFALRRRRNPVLAQVA